MGLHFVRPGGRCLVVDSRLVPTPRFTARDIEEQNRKMTEKCGRADARFSWGQTVQPSPEGITHLGTYMGRGRVWGFGRKYPWCVIILREGVRTPVSYSHIFWEPI